MARLPRLVVPQQPHHIIQCGNNLQLIFRDAEDHQRFLGWLKEAARACQVAIHAYVLLPDHLHLLATPSTAEGLAQMMQRIGRHYVAWYNNKHGRTGGLFQGRFRTSVIEAARYFMLCSSFIELNPVRAKLVADPLAFAWSSYAHHAGVRQDSVITDHALYWALGNTPFQREAAYTQLVEQGLSKEELVEINAALLKGWPLGSDMFKRAIEHNAQRQVLPARRGRPPKPKTA